MREKFFYILTHKSLWIITLLGFASGLPLALTSGTLEAWFITSDVSLQTVGFITLVGQPYIYKFLWAPLVDRYVWPFMGRRRGWMLVTQIGLVFAIMGMTFFDPLQSPWPLAAMAVMVAFLSATQDIVVDAYRTEILLPEERGLGSAFWIAAYRIGLIVSGGVAMILADNIGWQATFIIMAALMGVGIIATFLGQEPKMAERLPTTLRETFLAPLQEFMSRPAAVLLILLVVFYKFGDAFIAHMTSAFLLRGLGFSLTEVGSVVKMAGMFATIVGALVAGAIMVRISLFNALLIFGILQTLTNLGFLVLAWVGKNITVMTVVIISENFFGGMGTIAFLALLMSLCNPSFTATQFALLSVLASVPRESLGPLSAYLVTHFGWSTYFWATFICGFPAIVILLMLRRVLTKPRPFVDTSA